ncbi:MAG: hypothetical protein WCQ20_01310 [Synechococcaceae cyanobacterium ELA739]
MVLMVSKAPPPQAERATRTSRPGPWPTCWPEREKLLERQHQILQEQIGELILAVIAGTGEPQALAERHSRCQRLLRQLRLHLRLEERWLAACGCLCPGHRAIHQLVVHETEAGLNKAAAVRQQQLLWLRGLQAWLQEHTGGPDAHAYGIARSLAPHQP